MKRFLPLLLAISFICFSSSGCKGSRQVRKANKIMIAGYKVADIYFKVQIGAFATPLAEEDPFFSALGSDVEVMVDEGGNLTRYTSGHFKLYEDADAYEQMLKAKGYLESFVVCYGSDHRRIDMPMEDILKIYRKVYKDKK